MYKCTIHLDLKFMCLCLGKKNQRVPNACAHEWEHPICIQKDVQIKQYAMRKGVLMGSSKRNCSISNTRKRSQARNALRRVFDDEVLL